MQSKYSTKLDPKELIGAVKYLEEGVSTGRVAKGVAKGILYSLTETLGVMLGDIDLPNHIQQGYQGVLEEIAEVQQQFSRAE